VGASTVMDAFKQPVAAANNKSTVMNNDVVEDRQKFKGWKDGQITERSETVEE
jgi:hypothetical protein